MSLEDEDRLDFGEDGEDEYEDQISLGEGEGEGEGEGQQDQQAESSGFEHAQTSAQHSDSAAANGVAVPISTHGRSVRPGASEDEQGPLPRGWVVRLSRQGEVYYLHEPTKASMWDRPTETSLESPAIEDDAGTHSAAVPAASMATPTPTVEATTSASALHHTQAPEVGDMQVDTPVQAAGPTRETTWGRQPQRPQSQAFTTTTRDPALPSATAQRTAAAQSTARSAREVAAEAAAVRAAAKGVKAAEPSSAMARSDDRSAIPSLATRPRSPRNDLAIPTGPRAARLPPPGPQARMPSRNERIEDRSMDLGRNGPLSAATQVTGPPARAERDFRERPTFADDDRWRDGPLRSTNSFKSETRSDRHASDTGWAGRDRLPANPRSSTAPRPLHHSDVPASRLRYDDMYRDSTMKSEKRRDARDVPRDRPEERRPVPPREPVRAYENAQWAESAPTVHRDYRDRPAVADFATRDREDERQRFDDRQRSERGERTYTEPRSGPPRNFGREALIMERSQQDRRSEEDMVFDRRRPADRDSMSDAQRLPHLAAHVRANQRFDAVEPRDRGWGDRTGRGSDTNQNPRHPPRRRSPSPLRSGDTASAPRHLSGRTDYRAGNDRAVGADSQFGPSMSSADRSPPVKRQWGAPARAASPPTKSRTVDDSAEGSRPAAFPNDAPSDVAPVAAAAAVLPVPVRTQLDSIKATAVAQESAQPIIEKDRRSEAAQGTPKEPVAEVAAVEASKATAPDHAPLVASLAEEAKQTEHSSEVAQATKENAQQNKPPPLQRLARKREMSPGLASRLDRPLSPADARKQGPLSARTARAKARSPLPAEDSLPSPALSSRLEGEGQPSLLSRMSSEDGGPKRNVRSTVSRDEGRASKRTRLESRLESHNGEASSSKTSQEPVTLKQALNFAQRVAKDKAADATSPSQGISILGAGRQKGPADGSDTREGTPSSKALAGQKLLDPPANPSQINGSRPRTDLDTSASTASVKSLTIHGLAGLPPKPSVAEGSPRGRSGDATPPAPLGDSYRPAGRNQQGDRADSRGPRAAKQPLVDRYIPESEGPPARRRSPPAREGDRSGPRRFRRN